MANHPVPSVEAEMTNQMDQEVEEARAEVEAWVEAEHPRPAARELFRRDVDALIEAVRRQERERIFGAPDEERLRRFLEAADPGQLNGTSGV